VNLEKKKKSKEVKFLRFSIDCSLCLTTTVSRSTAIHSSCASAAGFTRGYFLLIYTERMIIQNNLLFFEFFSDPIYLVDK
jgi:hypothetical protein